MFTVSGAAQLLQRSALLLFSLYGSDSSGKTTRPDIFWDAETC